MCPTSVAPPFEPGAMPAPPAIESAADARSTTTASAARASSSVKNRPSRISNFRAAICAATGSVEAPALTMIPRPWAAVSRCAIVPPLTLTCTEVASGTAAFTESRSAAVNCTTSARRTKIPSTRCTKFGEIAMACRSVVLATCSRAYFSTPSPIASTDTIDPTPMITPSVDRIVRSGLARSVSIPTRSDSEWING